MNNRLKNLFDAGTRKLGILVLKRREGFHYVPSVYGKAYWKMHDIREDDLFRTTADKVVGSWNTRLYYDRLFTLYNGFKNAVRLADANETINIIEIGAYRGGTSYFLAELSQQLTPDRVKLYTVDTFEGH